MQSGAASKHSVGSVAGVFVKRKYLPSPYDVYFHVEGLEQEAKRLSLLPVPTMNAHHVMRWRRKQVWLIGLRIKELSREPQFKGA